jgi:hypothetical protein
MFVSPGDATPTQARTLGRRVRTPPPAVESRSARASPGYAAHARRQTLGALTHPEADAPNGGRRLQAIPRRTHQIVSATRPSDSAMKIDVSMPWNVQKRSPAATSPSTGGRARRRTAARSAWPGTAAAGCRRQPLARLTPPRRSRRLASAAARSAWRPGSRSTRLQRRTRTRVRRARAARTATSPSPRPSAPA